MRNRILGLAAGLFFIVSSAQAGSLKDEAHHIKDAPDCKEVIEHHCKADATNEAAVEKCLKGWYAKHHGKHDASEAELAKHKHCAKLIETLAHEGHS